MKSITKYQSNDGSEWNTPEEAVARDSLISRVSEVMEPLKVPESLASLLADHRGYYQHDLETLYACREGILQICRDAGMAETYPCFTTHGRDAHPLSVIGRILSEGNDPLAAAWNRFGRIDERGREWQQGFYAWTQTPTDKPCLNP